MKAPEQGRRRGTALVMVLVLSVGTLALVTTLISLSQGMVKTDRHRRETKELQEVVYAGVSMAVNEINRRRLEGSGYADPTAHGYGCMIFGIPPSGSTEQQTWASMGVPVRDATGKIVGRFRADIRPRTPGSTTDTVKILRVVAAFPTFDMPLTSPLGAVKTLAAGEVEIKRGNPPFDRNALSVRGPAMAGSQPGLHGGGNQVSISGLDAGGNVPAINISDTTTYNNFVANVDSFDGAGDNISGASADGSSVAYQEGTVTNDQAGLLNQQTATDIANGIDARVADVLSSPANKITQAQLDNNGTTNLGNGKFYIDTNNEIKGTITGSGTLVVTKKVVVKGKLRWNGDVIIANESGAGLDIPAGGELAVRDVTPTDTTDGTGVLCIQAMGDTTDQLGLHVKGDCFVGDQANSYPGAFTILGNANTPSTVVDIDSGSEIKVYGIFTIMGNALSIDFNPGGKISVVGSMALITPTGGTGMDIDVANSFHLNLQYSNTGFDQSLSALGQFFDPEGTKLPVSASTYWEVAPSQAYAEQNLRFGITADLATIPNLTDGDLQSGAPTGQKLGY